MEMIFFIEPTRYLPIFLPPYFCLIRKGLRQKDGGRNM